MSASSRDRDVDALATRREGGGDALYYESSAGEEINLWDYIHTILRRRWTVAAALTVSVSAALVLSLAATPTYEATALLQIQPGGPNVTEFDAVQETMSQSQAHYYALSADRRRIIGEGIEV